MVRSGQTLGRLMESHTVCAGGRRARRGFWRIVTLGVALAGNASVLQAQPVIDGNLSVLFDHLPSQESSEARARLLVEHESRVGSHVRIALSGYMEGLLADRKQHVSDAIIRPQDLSVELSYDRVDILAGMTRVVWGRLDELQPSDVVNPLDVSRFLFEGRSAARRPVWLVRGRVFATSEASVEAVVVPVFRAGRFDELDEPTSPFNLQRDACGDVATSQGGNRCISVPFVREEPDTTLRNLQGGVRFNTTTARLDWSVSAYRGFKPFGIQTPVRHVGVVERFPRFTMVASDFETVVRSWVIRGEVAAFVEDHFSVSDGIGILRGQALEGGVSVDRTAGESLFGGSVLVRRESANRAVGPALALEPGLQSGKVANTDVTLVGFVERRFARQTRFVRSFAAYNASDAHIFVRTIGGISLRSNLWLEGAVGLFLGSGDDVIGRFGDRHFVYSWLKVYF